MSISKKISNSKNNAHEESGKFNGAPCAYFDGLYQYFNIHATTFHAAEGKKWNGPCVNILNNIGIRYF